MMKTKVLYITYFVASLVLLSSFTSQAQSKSGIPDEIVKYYFVELITNPDRPELPKAQVDSIQAAHMANIGKMAEENVLMLAGPFEGGGGIFILKLESMEAAEKMAARDPAVRAGRLLTKIRPWYTGKGVFTAESKE
ncbi:YciI family protein [Fulvivirgaceae bacterium BMA10]|uniref:YciI family protein n=1 Tax=Splendidivirga corallicola TaxID=3051826 RepID=A0ABT8KL73_9BACT|nr:YciI family protein [Fulvivirgaceae bacterium BMA10]